MKLIMLMAMLINILFMTAMNPIMMGFSILLQTLTLSMLMMMISNYSWTSYIIMLIMAGGMMVLFSYMASIASNQILKTPQMKYIIVTMMVTILLIMFNYNKINLMYNIDLFNNMNINNLMIMKMNNMKSSMITIMILIYLFMTMMIINKITNINEGPIRMKN
uniref:NADH dehydrogenase subunit 6 n=1 Tax=Hydrometra greeni TaxID=1492928 RepID=C5HIP7_9HEMI|nr:NADH dehydrogenase subunit 6 [Hydrometra greeni]ACJ69492.1 NADH dehydrogenase subunit 6 [Hydrometra greeni]